MSRDPVFQHLKPISAKAFEVCRPSKPSSLLTAIFKTGNGESGNPGIGESGNPGIRESGNPGIGESGNRGIGESGNRGIRESGNPGIGESGNRGIRESGNNQFFDILRYKASDKNIFRKGV